MVKAKGELRILNMDDIHVSRIHPNDIERGDDDTVTIYGRGFVNTPELRILYGNQRSPLKPRFVNGTVIKFEVPKRLTQETGENDVVVSFASQQRYVYKEGI